MATMLDAVINLKDNFSSTLNKVEKQIGGFSRTAKRMGRDINKVGKNIGSVGSSLTKSFTVPLVGIGVAASKIGMDFERSMSEVKAVTGASSSEMKLLEKSARDAGKVTSKSAKESAEALKYMGLAGWNVTDSMNGLMPILRLSEAGNIDLGRASDLVTDSMSAMGIEVKDLPKYLDKVAQTSRKSNTDIDAMMEAYLGVGGVLRGLNISLDESSVALGMMANAGIKGSEAGTKLNKILLNLTAPTGQAKKALDELKLSAFDSSGKFKGLDNVLFEVKNKTKDMTAEQKNSYLSMIAGSQHIDGMNALMNGLDDSYVELKKSISAADGALDEMSKTMLANNKGSITQLKSGLDEVGLKIYDVLKPAIADTVEVLKKLTDKLNNLTPEQTEMITKFVKMAVVVGPVLMVIGKLTTGVGGAIVKFGKFAGVIKRLGFLSAIFSPGMIVVGVIAAIIAVGVLLYKNWDKIKAKVNEVFPNLKNQIGVTMERVKNIVTGAISAMKIAWIVLEPVIKCVWEVIKTAFIVGAEIIGNIINNVIQIFSGVVDFIRGVFTGNWEMAWQGVKDVFSGVFGSLGTIAKAPINGVITLVNKLIGGLNKLSLPEWMPGDLGGKGINIPLIPKLAKGTNNWSGGIVQVHERGGEIIDLPSGSRVYPHDKSIRIAREQGQTEKTNGIIITKNTFHVRHESDIDKIATKLLEKINQASINMA